MVSGSDFPLNHPIETSDFLWFPSPFPKQAAPIARRQRQRVEAGRVRLQ